MDVRYSRFGSTSSGVSKMGTMNAPSNPVSLTLTYADDTNGDWTPWFVAGFDGYTFEANGGVPDSYHADIKSNVSGDMTSRTFTLSVDLSDDTLMPDWEALFGKSYIVLAFCTDDDDGLPYLVGAYCSATLEEGDVPDDYIKAMNDTTLNGPVTEHVVTLDGDAIRAAFEPVALTGKVAGQLS